MFVVAPDGVVEVISLSNDAEGFVGVVPVDLLAIFAFRKREAPVLDIDMLMSCLLRNFKFSLGYGYCHAVEIIAWSLSNQFKNGGSQVGMGGDNISDYACRYVGSPNNERDVNVFFKSTLFPGLKSVLANMVAIVRSIDYVCVVKDAVVYKTRHNAVDNLVDGLKSSKA